MTGKLGNSDYIELRFDKDGSLQGAAASEAALVGLAQKVDQLFIVSHGWKTLASGARDAYEQLWTPLEQKVANSKGRWGVVGILWPSAQFQWDREEQQANAGSGGMAAASTGGGGGSRDLTEDEAIAHFDVLADLLDLDQLKRDELKQQLQRAGQNGAASPEAETFVREIRKLSGMTGGGTSDAELSAARTAFSGSSEDILNALSLAVATDPADVGGQAGLLDNVGNVIEGVFHGLAGAADFATFYKMKERAGKVGSTLGSILAANSAVVSKAHLCGHSFGGRLVTAAASRLKQGQSVKSLTLMQAAFSQWGLSSANAQGILGAFANVVDSRHAERITITHTRKDWPLSYAYARASFLSNQAASAISGPQDRFGAMGANGAQGIGNGLASQRSGSLQTVTQTPRSAHLVSNIQADQTLVSGHNDVWTDRMAGLIAWSLT